MTAARSAVGGDDKEAIGRARSLFLYLLSVGAVSHALQAWEGEVGPSPLVLGIWAITLGLAQEAGERMTPHLEAIEEVKRARIRLFGAIVYLGVAVPGLVVAVYASNPVLARLLVPALAALQPVFLVLAGLGRDRKGVLTNALFLSFFACLRGGFLSSVTAASTVAFLGGFLVFDHHYRTLTSYPTGPGAWFGLALRDAAKTVLPVVLGLLVFLAAVPPQPARGALGELRATSKELDTEGMSLTILIWIGGAGGVYLVGRLLSRPRRKGQATLEVVEPIRGKVEHLPAPPEPPAPAVYPGRRGRILRAYLNFLAAAARAGLARKPHLTPREFARVVKQPPGPLGALTDTFVRARYGPAEPTDHDVLVAESNAELIVRDLRFRHSDRPPRDVEPGR